jgi:hypothetical protein
MKCPYCIEDINDQALVCSHCQRDLLFFRPYEDRLQSFDTRIVEITDHLSTIRAVIEDMATGKVGKEETSTAVVESKPVKLTRWRLVGTVLLAVVLSSATLLVFALLQDQLASEPYRKAIDNYHKAADQQAEEWRLRQHELLLAQTSSPTDATKAALDNLKSDGQKDQQSLQEQREVAENQYSQQQRIMFIFLIPALLVVPLAFGIWLGIRLTGVQIKYYLLLGLSAGLVEGSIWWLLLWLAGEQLGVFAIALLGVNSLRTTLGFLMGGLMGDWIERKRRPGVRRAGVAEQLAVKWVRPRIGESTNTQGDRGPYDVRLEKVKNTISAVAPILGLIGVITPSYFAYKTFVNKQKAEAERSQPANDNTNQQRKNP